MENIYDKGFKRIFSNKAVLLHFLKRYLPEPWVKDLSEEDLVQVDKEFVLENFQTRESDLVYQIRFGDGILYFFLILELQSTVDQTMAFRLLNYGAEVTRRDVENTGRRGKKSSGFQIPAILPVVLYNGDRPWTAAPCLEALQRGPDTVKGNLNLKYHLIDIRRLPEAFLLDGGTLLECVFLMDRSIGRCDLRKNADKAKSILLNLNDEEWRELTLWVRDVLSYVA